MSDSNPSMTHEEYLCFRLKEKMRELHMIVLDFYAGVEPEHIRQLGNDGFLGFNVDSLQELTEALTTLGTALLKVMPYDVFLKTRYWAELRERILQINDSKCALCKSSSNLHVHHKTYERRGHEEDDDLTVLCADCHAKFHDKFPNPV